jgi:capsular polysaccharide transport system permease protein
MLSIFFFCLSMSFFNATIGALFKLWRIIWKFMTIPLLFLSGVIYVPITMPPEVQAIISWNPVLHCIEGLRVNSYLDYISLYDPVYLNTVSTVLLLLSLVIERLFRKEIIGTKQENEDDDEELF